MADSSAHGWLVIETPIGDPHIIPENDLRPHTVSWRCWCGPRNDEGVCVHNSMDGREAHERGRKPS